MSILLRQLVISTILGLGLLIGGAAGAAMADPGQGTPPMAGATPPTEQLGPVVSGLAGQGQSLAVRTFIRQTIDNLNVISPVKGGFK